MSFQWMSPSNFVLSKYPKVKSDYTPYFLSSSTDQTKGDSLLAAQAVAHFVRFLGRAAGNLALITLREEFEGREQPS